MEALSDNEAMQQILGGNSRLLGVLFERHRGSLFGSFFRRTGDASLSEDLVQDTFIRAFKYRESFRKGQEFLPWLHQIARNVLYAALRKNGRQPGGSSDDGELLSQVECERPAPDQASSVSIERDYLYQALESLPEQQRQLIVLRRIENRSYSEIAQLLGCELAPLKVRVHRAFLVLQKTVLAMTQEAKS